ncbi:unnamed protein product, partial [Porites lobata]
SKTAASQLEKCETALIVVDCKAYQLGILYGDLAIHEIEELVSNQETDTRVVLYLDYAVRRGFKSAVVRTSDTDIFILLHYVHSIPITIYLDTGSRKHRQIINVSQGWQKTEEGILGTV